MRSTELMHARRAAQVSEKGRADALVAFGARKPGARAGSRFGQRCGGAVQRPPPGPGSPGGLVSSRHAPPLPPDDSDETRGPKQRLPPSYGLTANVIRRTLDTT